MSEHKTNGQALQQAYAEVEKMKRRLSYQNKISAAHGAAKTFGIKPTTLASRIKNMNI